MLERFKHSIFIILIPFLIIGVVKAGTYLWPEDGGTGTPSVPTTCQTLVGTDGGVYEASSDLCVDTANSHIGIGDTTPDYKLEVLDVTTQLALTYSDGNEAHFLVDSNGDLTIDTTGGDITIGSGNFILAQDPTARLHAATKEYVDMSLGGISFNYFLSDTSEGVIANYNLMYPEETGQVASTASEEIDVDPEVIQNYITETTDPTFTVLVPGTYVLYTHANVNTTTGFKDAAIYFELWKRDTEDDETLLLKSETSEILTTTSTSIILHANLSAQTVIGTTDRLVLKVYGDTSGSGSDPTVTIHMEGDNDCRLGIRTTLTAFDSRYVEIEGDTMTDILTVTTLQVGTEFALPSEDGTSGQVMQTDGSGNLSWTTVAGGHDAITLAGTPNYLTLSGQQITLTKLDIGDDTNLTAGRSLTLTDDDVLADAETYVCKHKIAFEDPTADDDFFFGEIAAYAETYVSIYCKTLVGTVDLDVTIAGSDINGTDITCDTSGVLDDSLGGNTAGATGEELKLAITSVASSPTYLLVQVNCTYDD